ncbi:MAG: VWA domain-containing protein, partial [Chloroflexales bacterium]|nr:VWA domain-containing protein [Chloroflexales bacterium]
TARAALIEALAIVTELPYAGPPVGAPHCPTDAIRRRLVATLDGAFSSDNALGDERAYRWMASAAACLDAIAADSSVDPAVQLAAAQANERIVSAARLMPVHSLKATALFGATLPTAINETIQLAEQALAAGDAAHAAKQRSAAIDAYRMAWIYARDAIDRLWATDPDGDHVLDQFEGPLGTRTDRSDTDGDGISDGDELALTGTDPTQADSHSDRDGDGLTALEEVDAGVNPLHPDTDRDTLDDRFELREFGSDPRKQDTDHDGLTDDSEFRLGTDPRNPDSDTDGTPDGAEVYTSRAAHDEHGLAVTVAITGVGDVAGTVQFQTLMSNTLFQAMPGQIGPAVDITAEAAFSAARVAMRFDPAQVPHGDVAKLRILYYDEAAHVFKPTDGAYGVDVRNGVAWAETSHFTTFVLFYIPNWNTVWTYTMAPGRDPTDPVTKSLDMLLALDSSGSMRWNDPDNLRTTAAKGFIDALLAGDRVGVIDFDADAVMLQSLTTVTATAKTAVDRVDSHGGTCIGAAIDLATREIVAQTRPERLKAQIVLTDGVDEGCSPDYTALIAAANAADIQIYTIGLGAGVNSALLQRIANETAGQYFPVQNAADLPDVFRRIAEEPDPTLDTDGDGLPNWLELEGFRRGNGSIITTDPAEFDSDGDGLSDGAEAGARQTGPDGDYYDGITDPTKVDTDGDGLFDPDEVYGITDPTNADTDGDGLDDLTEINASFDPLHGNPDGDHRPDAIEFIKNSDPFHYDKTGLEYVSDFLLGLALGDLGENAANAGYIAHDTIRSFGYLSGWIASGFAVAGDIRDTLAALARGDLADTALNALGLIPLLGDGAKVAKVLTEFLQWAPDLIVPTARWAATTFADHPQIFTTVGAVIGFGGKRLQSLPEKELQQLSKARNKGDVFEAFLENGGELISRNLSTSQVDALYDKVKRNWDTTKKYNVAQAMAVEAADDFLRTEGYTVLYVDRNTPLPGYGSILQEGPDLIAVKTVGTEQVLAVVESKGSIKEAVIDDRRLATELANTVYRQPEFNWLVIESERYLGPLRASSDPNHQEAARLLKELIDDNNKTFEAIVVARSQESKWGHITEHTIPALQRRTSAVKFVRISGKGSGNL